MSVIAAVAVELALMITVNGITMQKEWKLVFDKVEINKSRVLLDASYHKGFEVGIAYFASYNGSELPEVIEIPNAIAFRGRLSHVAFKMGVEDGWKFERLIGTEGLFLDQFLVV